MDALADKVGNLDILPKKGVDLDQSPEFPLVYKDTFVVRSSEEGFKTEYDVIVIRFSDSWQLFLTHDQNISTWLCTHNNPSNVDVSSVSVLLGDRTQEYYQVYGRNFIKILVKCLENSGKIEKYSPQRITLIAALNLKVNNPLVNKMPRIKVQKLSSKSWKK
ncbi:conserved hypothetical protein [Theileria equi strain WA]|uniref:Uncharacterized protein n=1 Tax=Theileria equi strain WA TaxID=1537102 RepID=L1LGB7_THEEQ|nr:conserved hypothetical protein [Theileria equi strain WA]EKX74309.1 conserved hypothetical protein [Theileria equi strain WA]|eukprot:XP_004833761.1 conserved hypothetical protein [Theileria equi strain WA]